MSARLVANTAGLLLRRYDGSNAFRHGCSLINRGGDEDKGPPKKCFTEFLFSRTTLKYPVTQ